MNTYQLTLKELITGKGLALTVKAQDIDKRITRLYPGSVLKLSW